MPKFLLFNFLVIVGVTSSYGQVGKPVHEMLQDFRTISALPTDSTRHAALDSLWKPLVRHHQIPYVTGDSVLFLYRGEASTVAWRGDFNSWGYNTQNQDQGIRLKGTDVWWLKASFPRDARLDYKVLINNNEWILDPVNPHRQWSGVGGGSPNSELRMPLWKPDPVTQPDPSAPVGKVETDILFNSKTLGYQITYSVYFPAQYERGKAYPVIYITDGYEYLHPQLGNMAVVLNNLIAEKKMEPVIALFIDHREPVNRSNNRRMTELAMNPTYLSFVTEEFIPSLETKLNLHPGREKRAILGTSMGGLTAAYFSFTRPDVFGLAGIQSPAFWFKPAIYTVCDNPANPPVKIFLTTGSINDAQDGSRKLKAILDKNVCAYQYLEVSQGHSWGNWRDTLDDILVYFFPYSPNR